ncbi:WD40 repeat domain-containing protein [Arcobacter lanthieri]|uniref:WD40 repeat domain-containing protein n=1 Tax=Aliarcobacter lanthieri TaxID=1355374 RepID=UPI0019220430|nr:WD40 repeat domain-containing protein [Aliarcobacter lanthieri]MBL3520497.1 WD40 repeat domain-containing protein [Aliarcobacter lanthieri]
MLRIIFFTLFYIVLSAKEVTPSFSLKASGAITDFIVENNILYIGTTTSSIDIFSLEKKEKISSIKIPKIKDFLGDIIDTKIFSVDKINNDILILSQGESGGRNIFIYKNDNLKNIINAEDRLFIAQAKFLDENYIIYALLSNQLFIYDIKNSKIINELQVSQSSFSHFVLSDDKKTILVTDESGVINQYDTKSFKKLKTFKGQNVDRVFQVDIKKDTILASGQDRRVAIYFTNEKASFYKSFDFLVYAGALSPSSNLACVSNDENNNALVFDINKNEDKYLLTQNKAILTKILFLDEDTVAISSDDENINFYNLRIKE